MPAFYVPRIFNTVFTVAPECSMSQAAQVLYLYTVLLIMMVSTYMPQCSPNKTLSRGFKLNFIYNICKISLIFCNKLNGNLNFKGKSTFRGKSTSVVSVTKEEIYKRVRERNSRNLFKEIILTESWRKWNEAKCRRDSWRDCRKLNRILLDSRRRVIPLS